MRTSIFILLFCSIVYSGGWRDRISDDSLRTKVEKNLAESGENRIRLEDALNRAPQDILNGVAFLIANSPAVNLIAYHPDSLLNEVSLAYEARRKFPWGKEISEALFLYYVLPNQVTQEQLTYYRKYFMDNLSPILDTVKTASQAAVAVNYWCGERVRFQQTQRQDQSAFQTLSSGYGRCEEMMIVYVSALRSVCIPAREAWTPYWATGDNNHAWTELWADGEWHFAGSCEPQPTLDNAWFNNTVKRAAVIMSCAFGVPKTDEEIYRKRENFAIINSTPYYIPKPARLTVETDAESTNVFLCVFNFGAIRPIMRFNTGDSTRVSFSMGHGDYIIYAGNKDTFDWKKVRTEFGEETRVSLNPQKGKTLGQNAFWLRYPAEPDRQ